jgi:hypothetical protein
MTGSCLSVEFFIPIYEKNTRIHQSRLDPTLLDRPHRRNLGSGATKPQHPSLPPPDPVFGGNRPAVSGHAFQHRDIDRIIIGIRPVRFPRGYSHRLNARKLRIPSRREIPHHRAQFIAHAASFSSGTDTSSLWITPSEPKASDCRSRYCHSRSISLASRPTTTSRSSSTEATKPSPPPPSATSSNANNACWIPAGRAGTRPRTPGACPPRRSLPRPPGEQPRPQNPNPPQPRSRAGRRRNPSTRSTQPRCAPSAGASAAHRGDDRERAFRSAQQLREVEPGVVLRQAGHVRDHRAIGEHRFDAATCARVMP